ncbi:DHA14-like major facilitator [Mycena galericulata]|nr:DHA14-like major facilitator [Mycena galericulata]
MSSPENKDADSVTPRRRSVVPNLRRSLSFSKFEKANYLELGSQSQVNLPVEEPYPNGIKLAVLILALGLSIFLVALDNTIITTAIPKITDQFNSLDDVGWYGSACVLATTAGTQLLFGKFYSHFSIKPVYVISIAIFELGSLLCGAAPTSNIFIAGRAIAGVGNAGIFSGGFIIIANTVPLSKRPLYTGMIGGMGGIASVSGPLLGGVLTDKLSWRWCFFVNVPLAAISLAIIVFFFQMPRTGASKPTESVRFLQRLAFFDPWGTLVFLPGILGGSKYPWNSARIIALLVVSGILISLFVGIQFWKQDHATIPPRILMRRSIWSSSLYAFSIGASFIIVTFYLPIWFQAIKGVSAVKSGVDNLPVILALVLGSVLAGGIITKIGYYAPIMILSSILTVFGTGMLSTLAVTSPQTRPMPFEVLSGLGVGIGMQQPILASQTVLELKDVPVGTAIIMFAQTLGSALFIAIAQTVFTTSLVSGITAHVPGLDPSVVLSAGADSLKETVAPAFLPAVTAVYNQALSSAFIVAMAMAGVSLVGAFVVEWRSVKGKKMEATMAV